MFANRTFQVALLLSLIAHGGIFLQNSNLSLFSKNKSEAKLEVSYLKDLQEVKEEKNTHPKREQHLLKFPPNVSLEKTHLLPAIDRDKVFKDVNKKILSGPGFTKPILVKPDVIAIKKKITLPAIAPQDLDKIDNPSYVSYYQIVREKIKRAAYQNYTRTETGEVYLSFIIANNGYLTDVRMVDEKSSTSVYLREIASRSVKDASPFPNFPKELSYPHLSFNVIISFEIE